MENNYCATYHFFYRVEKKAGWGDDHEGNPAAIYTEIKVHKGTKAMTEEHFNSIHEKYRASMAAQLKVNVDYVIPIGRDEYLENTEEEED